jgi:hypothetical protein
MMVLMSAAPQQSSRAPRSIEDQHSCSTLLGDFYGIGIFGIWVIGLYGIYVFGSFGRASSF